MDNEKINWREILISALASAVVSMTVTKLSDFILKLSFPLQMMVAILLFLAFLSISVSVILNKKIKKFLEQINKISKEKDELSGKCKNFDVKIRNLESTISDYENSSLKNFKSEANVYFLMSLTQNYFEPLRIEYLKEAAKSKHVFAALILGNLYETGLTYNNMEIVPKDYDKAKNLYMEVKDNDCFGVSEWLLGWLYEKRLTTESKSIPEEQCLNQAKIFYEQSRDKGFPKAYNSLGKFYEYGWGGLGKNINKDRQNYSTASEMGDIHGSLNCGHSNLNEYLKTRNDDRLNDAIEEYQKAAQKSSVEGWFKLAYSLSLKSDIDGAKIYYIKAISGLQDNIYCAAAYYNLFLFIKQNKLHNDKDIIIAIFGNDSTSIGEAGVLLECIIRSYTIFSNAEKNGIILTKEYKEYFEEIKKIILHE